MRSFCATVCIFIYIYTYLFIHTHKRTCGIIDLVNAELRKMEHCRAGGVIDRYAAMMSSAGTAKKTPCITPTVNVHCMRGSVDSTSELSFKLQQ